MVRTLNSPRFNRFSRGPLLSVVIPTYNRPRELALCLEGFAQQTAPSEQFEVIVVDDGSAQDVAAVCERFRDRLLFQFVRQDNWGPSVARNAGIGRAQSRLLLLYDDDLRPFPEVVERCLTFHRRLPDERDASLLHFAPDAGWAEEPFTRWAFPRLYPFQAIANLENWKRFWSGTITCKKSLFRRAQFNPDYHWLEDSELALRLSSSIDLTVCFDARPASVMTRQLSLEPVLAREYCFGYFYYKLMMDYPGQVSTSSRKTDVISDQHRLATLFLSARALGKLPTSPERLEVLCSLWTRIALHARAEGWVAARDGRPARPPGTVGPFLRG